MTNYQLIYSIMAMFAAIGLALSLFYTQNLLNKQSNSHSQQIIAVLGSFIFILVAAIFMALALEPVRAVVIAFFGRNALLFAFVCAVIVSVAHYLWLRK